MIEVKRGEIWNTCFAPVIGSEQGGYRPALILQNNKGNIYGKTTIIAAITSKVRKDRLPTHVEIITDFLPKESVILLEHIRTVDKSRLLKYLGTADREVMLKVEKAIAISFGLDYLGGQWHE
jgi:mRNA interferase MazF